jgi:hypothetical protein
MFKDWPESLFNRIFLPPRSFFGGSRPDERDISGSNRDLIRFITTDQPQTCLKMPSSDESGASNERELIQARYRFALSLTHHCEEAEDIVGSNTTLAMAAEAMGRYLEPG